MELRPRGITKAHLKQASIGVDYWSCDFDSYLGPAKAKKLAKDYLLNLNSVKEEGVGLVLVGPTGTGKTTLATIVLKYLLRAGWSGYMTSISEIVEEIKKEWNTAFLARCRESDFLLLDDLGKEHVGPTGFSANIFDNLIRYRTQQRLVTFMTTNLTRTEIQSRYGNALLSLVEGKMHVVPITDKNVRETFLKPKMEKRFAEG